MDAHANKCCIQPQLRKLNCTLTVLHVQATHANIYHQFATMRNASDDLQSTAAAAIC